MWCRPQKGLDAPLGHSAVRAACGTEPARIPAILRGWANASAPFEKSLLCQVFAWWGSRDSAHDTDIITCLVKCVLAEASSIRMSLPPTPHQQQYPRWGDKCTSNLQWDNKPLELKHTLVCWACLPLVDNSLWLRSKPCMNPRPWTKDARVRKRHCCVQQPLAHLISSRFIIYSPLFLIAYTYVCSVLFSLPMCVLLL